MEIPKIPDGEYRFADLVWENEPINSTALIKTAQERLGWKKATSYTVLRKLCEKGILKNENATVTAIVKKRRGMQAGKRTADTPEFRELPACLCRRFPQG